MDGKNDENPIKQIPIGDLKVDPEAEDLLDSEAMAPYLNLAMAMMSGTDTGPAMNELAALPLDKRYVWRVASALKWAFVDLETLSVEADRRTLPSEDRKQLMELLKHRPLQFCMFLSGLFGQKQMELMMVAAIRDTRSATTQDGQS